ncbi:protein mono-ADP-ribosyltransferase PARP14-like [Branchiostoma floridae]|uniref:Protein mono-ADP-ribosyltransferase PARP14-like n=1 Tax=Branchiostoma floridae TaxID=7739 RepID=A0A9J7LHZ0_BRAFL|nr:protein mono-ADP-ribosyltransferase PARP14-like [Branchiostoma floridae]
MSTCLKHADKDSERTIAFPAVGTGGLGYPKDVVARLMFEETLSHSRNNPAGDLEKAKFVVYDQLNFEAFLSELGVKNLVKTIRQEPTKPPPPKPQKPEVLLDIYAGCKEDVEFATNKIRETANRESKTHDITDKHG